MHQDTIHASTTSGAKPADTIRTADGEDLDKEDSEVIVWNKDINGAADPKIAEATNRISSQKLPSPLIINQQAVGGQSSRDLAAARNSWRFNNSGQIVDEAGSQWEIADEIMKLQISEGNQARMQQAPETTRDVLSTEVPSGGTSVPRNESPVATPSSSSSSSPPAINSSRHSRDPSYSDTSSSDSSVVTPLHFKTVNTVTIPVTDGEGERGISDAELKHIHQLQQVKTDIAGGNASTESFNELHSQPPFPSIVQNPLSYPLAHQHHPRPPHLAVVPGYDYRQQVPRAGQPEDVLQVDYNIQPRLYPSSNGNGVNSAPTDIRASSFAPGRQEAYRQPTHRGTVSASYVMNAPHAAMPSASSILTSPQSVPGAFYPGMPGHPGHPLNGQLYDIIVPQHDHLNGNAANRPQFRPGHQHSISDPASLRDATTLALIGNSLHVMQQQHQAQPQHTPPLHPVYPQAPGLFTPGSAPSVVYPNPQFYGPSMVSELDVVNALARLPPGYNLGLPGYPPAPPVDPQLTGGPSANNRKLGLYKTELCRSWEEKGSCRYGPKCQFAHGEEEIRKVARHPKYKTEICRTFWVSGSCPYGKRCCFIHTELPSAGAPGAPGAGATPEEQRAYQNNVSGVNVPGGRTRSMSTGSDPNEPQSSLLARISAKRNESTETSSSNGQPNYGRPSTGTLRVDTSSLENAAKANGYPYTSNPALPAAGVRSLSDMSGGVSPAPASAAPDFGRHNAARLEAVGYGQRLGTVVQAGQGNVRHAYNNSETMTSQQRSGVSSPFNPPEGARVSPPHGHTHARSDSGNGHHWGAAGVRAPQAWVPELAVNTGRFNERTWA